jgi:hypothetical protein
LYKYLILNTFYSNTPRTQQCRQVCGLRHARYDTSRHRVAASYAERILTGLGRANIAVVLGCRGVAAL